MAQKEITDAQIRHAEIFTAIYQKHEGKSAELRELECLKVQYPATLLPIRDKDLFAGMRKPGVVGFAPKNEDGFGYYCHVNDMEGYLAEERNTEENKKRISTLLDFWKTEQSKARVRAAFPEDMQKALPYDGLEEANAAFPLYRMAGWVLDYSKLMKLGIPGLLAEIGQCQKEHPQEILYQAMAGALELVVCCGKHYIREIDEELQKRENLSDQRKKQLMCIRESLAAICVHAPKTMHEAMQLAWLYSLLCVTMDYGRMDDYIGEFYIRDLESGRLTQTEAQEYVNSFWTMIADTDESVHGRVMIGGRGRKHEASADAFALLAMEASRQVVRHIPQLSLRLYQGCNPALLEKALDVLGEGRTFPILYHDDVNIPSVVSAFGVPEAEAKDFFPFGCGEYVLGHKSFGSPNGIINLLRVVELALFDETKNYSDFEELYQVFLTYCDYYFTYLARQEELEYRIAGEEAPYLLQSMLYDDCIARGKGLFCGGIRYLGGTVETYGNISASDSLYAIKTAVFDRKLVSLEELKEALSSDFSGKEQLQKLLHDIPKFGNDDDKADEMAVRVHEDVCRIIKKAGKETRLSSYLAVLINNDHNVKLGGCIGASADGRRAGRPMSNANGPTAGYDIQGITALLNSMVKLRTSIHAGSVQNMKFSKEMFREHRDLVKGILETYFEKGGSQAMINVVDKGELEQAMIRPEEYQDLFVRVGGYSGRFVSLPKEVQLDILNRTLYE